jgi:signal transduction histidine kinase
MSQIAAPPRSSSQVLNFRALLGGYPVSISRQLLYTIASLALLLILCWVDVMTGPHVHLGLLYVVPVLVAAWYAGRWPGYVLVVAASTGWFFAGRPPTDGSGIVVNTLNLLIRGVFYTLMIELLMMLRDFGRRLELSVQERTAQLRQEIAQRELAQESLRKLAGQLSAAEDAERRRIAYDIHDALSQMLGVVKMNLETVVAESPTDSRQFERLSDVVRVLDDLIRQTREMTFDLHPSMLDHFGLVPTLQRFAEDFQRRTMAEVTINEGGERVQLDTSLASYLFRAIKEVVNNAVKHGNAKEIIVAIHWENGHLRCVVDDDGRGFDPAKALAPQARRGLGLAGIDERLTSLGGNLRVESQPGNGARMILEVPVAQKFASV